MSKYYKNIDTGEIFSLEELRTAFEHFQGEMVTDQGENYSNFDEYLEEMLEQGLYGYGGLQAVDMKWVYIEDMTVSRGLFEETIIEADTEGEAFEKAVSLWDGLTDHDKADRSDAWLGLYAVEDGVVDLDSEVSHLEIKNA